MTIGDGPDQTRYSQSILTTPARQAQHVNTGEKLDTGQFLTEKQTCDPPETHQAHKEAVAIETDQDTQVFSSENVSVSREVLLKRKSEKTWTKTGEIDIKRMHMSDNHTACIRPGNMDNMEIQEHTTRESGSVELKNDPKQMGGTQEQSAITEKCNEDQAEDEDYEEMCRRKGWNTEMVKKVSEMQNSIGKSTSGPSGQSVRNIKKKHPLRRSRTADETHSDVGSAVKDDMVLEALKTETEF
jgi:hypothetical protein